MNTEIEEKIKEGIIYLDFENRRIKGYCKASKWKEQFNKIIDLLKED